MRIDKKILDYLREKVPVAFQKSTNMQLVVARDPESPFYIDLSEDIGQVLKNDIINKGLKVPGGHTFKKLFYELNNREYDPPTIYILQKYCLACLNNTNYKQFEAVFKGCDLIDLNFEEKVKFQIPIHKHSDFYLAKQDNDCQWYGIVWDWDCERDKFKEVKDILLKCFTWESRVTIVIYGGAGCGKSTFLRRLAITCIKENLNVLWIRDIGHFYSSDLDIISKTPKDYLVFLEDWGIINDTEMAKLFLNRIFNIKNIRLIIGDREIAGKEYNKYLLSNNAFKLINKENENIIKKALKINDEWEESKIENLLYKEFYNAPIFLNLFIIARAFDDDDLKKTTDSFCRFKEIIESDIKKIYFADPGLAIALYYWASMYSNHFTMFIPWHIFLKVAEYYNKQVSVKMSPFNNNDPVFKILSYYISFDLLSSQGSEIEIFYFNHDLLAKGLTQVYLNEWYYNDEIENEFIQVLKSYGLNGVYTVNYKQTTVFIPFSD